MQGKGLLRQRPAATPDQVCEHWDVLLMRIWHIGTSNRCSRGDKMSGIPQLPNSTGMGSKYTGTACFSGELPSTGYQIQLHSRLPIRQLQLLLHISCHSPHFTISTEITLPPPLPHFLQSTRPSRKLLPTPTTPQTRVLILFPVSTLYLL